MRWGLSFLLLSAAVSLTACDPPPREEQLDPESQPSPSTPPITDHQSSASASPAPTSSKPSRPAPPQVPRKQIDVSKLYNDVLVESRFVTVPSDRTAAEDRADDDSYALRLTVEARIPSPSADFAAVSRNSPDLATALPGLAELFSSARVSPAFARLYELKIDYTKARLNRLDTLLTRHNFFDCDTILELQNAETGRRALFLQGDMDVNTDGSDGDRNYPVDGSSMFFQPQTSYRWKRTTDRPNPFLETTKRLLAEAEKEYEIVGLPVARNRQLEATIAHEKATLYEIDVYSFLISAADPFIVLPGFMIRDASGPFAPQVGDYAAVVYEGVTYPALLGDVGPSFKMGEASLRLTKELNPRSSAYSRPVSSLDVTYLVFPGTADPKSAPPDLARWQSKVSGYLADLGLTPADLHVWEDVIKPWPTPTPTPEPSASPATIPPTTTPDAEASSQPSSD